jgi:hypothetical protein
MAKTCKKCGMRFEDEKRFEIHKGVHGRKSKVSQYEDARGIRDILLFEQSGQ